MKPELKKLLLLNLPYLLFVYLFAKCGQAYRLAAGADASAKLLHLTSGISAAFANPLPSLHPFDLCMGVAGAVAVRLIVYSKGKNAKKYRKGEEYGSARWGTAKDIAPYIDPKFENNILLTQTERLTMTGRPKDPKTARNKNVLVIGGSGSGKTRFYVKPNLMQCFPTSDYPTSFVVTDPKGTLVLETGQMFQRAGYRVKILNTINFSKSMKYNPFVYIHSEKDVLKLVNTLIANTKGEGEKSAEDFWVKSERLFYTALIGYIWYEAPAEEMNFTTLLEMINASEAREDDPEFQSPVDLMFERLEQKDPDHFAVRQYKKFLLSAGKTRSSILISCGARLAPFDIREVRELMEDDEMELDTIGDEKTVLFLIMSDTDTTFNFILAMLQSQLINLLCDRADDNYVNLNGQVGSEIKTWSAIKNMPEEQQTAVQSQMRAVYTACSRARDVLYVISDLKPGTPMEEIIKQVPDRTPLPQSSTQSGTPSTGVRTGNKRNTVTKRTASATIKERLLNEVVDHVTIKAVIQETKKDTTVMIDLAKYPKQKGIIGKKVGETFKLAGVSLTYKITKIIANDMLIPKDVASSPAKQGSAVQAGKTQPKSLKDFFVSKGFKAVDCRSNNGCLWILGERKELAPYVTEAERLFGVAGGYGAGKASSYKPAWWTKSNK